jgi:phage gp29-like protein
MRGQGAPFINAFKFLDSQITQAIQHQPLTTQESAYGTRAQANVHENVADTIAKQGKKGVVRTTRRDMIVPFVRYNYGEAALPYAPIASLGETEDQDWSAVAAGIAQLQMAGFLDISQYPGLDEKLSFPARTAGWEQRMAAVAAAAKPQPGVGAGGERNGKAA